MQTSERRTDKVQREKKTIKNPAQGMDVCVVCCRGISDMSTEDTKVHNESKEQKERKTARKNTAEVEIFCICPDRLWGTLKLQHNR